MASRKHLLTATVYDKRGRVLARATNSYDRTHPRMRELCSRCGEHHSRVYLNAEVAAILRALKRGVPQKIFVERYAANGEPRLARPCAMCMEAIREAGITRIEYTC